MDLEKMDQNTPAEEVNNTEVEAKEPEETPLEEPKPKTIEEALDDKRDESVPLAKFLDIKKEKKALEKEIADLKSRAEQGEKKSELSADLNAIADKYDVDPKFLEDLTSVIYSKAKGEAEETLNSKLKPLEAKEKAEKIDKLFNENYERVIEEMPEYSEVVNKNVIKELSLLPQNSKKTFQQIIEETYGKTVSGKKTLEPTTPRGGKNVSIDHSRMNDPKYYAEVMANPDLKKEYNKGLADRLRL